MSFPLERHTIFLTLGGSHAHGTAREGSDVDLRGVCVAPLSVRLSSRGAFEQYEGPLPEPLAAVVGEHLRAHPTAGRAHGVKTECVVYDVAKFLGLCAGANPNALEILFADEGDWMLETPAWRRLYAARERFLTRKVQQTFLGYAMAQLRKIRSHRSWLLQPPAKKPSREDFGLPADGGALTREERDRLEEAVAARVREYRIDDLELSKVVRLAVQERVDAFCRDVLSVPLDERDERMRAAALHALHVPAEVVALLNAERKYRTAMKHWEAYETWKAQRNPARAELERRHGYDTKHAMHLVRLMRMGREILEHGTVRVRRPDAAELRALREGAWSFDDLVASAAAQQQELERAAARSKLPGDVEPGLVDELALPLMMDAGA